MSIEIINQILKTRIYIENPADAPQGVKVETGERGGLYYESSWSALLNPEKEKVPGKAWTTPKQPKVKYESNIPGLYGHMPTFDSMPKNFGLDEINIKKMNLITEKSMKLRREIAYSLERRMGKFQLENEMIGNENSVATKSGKFGNYHTHPGVPDAHPSNIPRMSVGDYFKRGGYTNYFINSFSFDDLKNMCTGMPQWRGKIEIAQNTFDDTMWIAFATSKNHKINHQDAQKLWILYHSQAREEGHKTKISGKDYRRIIFNFCNAAGIKLYYGKPDKLEEYDGSW